MLHPDDLAKSAVKLCQSHAQKVLNGDLTVTAAPPRREWDGHLMRTVHHQVLTIWRKYGRMEIILDGARNLIGFVDHDKYAEAGDRELSKDEAVSLVRKAGVIPAEARLESYASAPAPDGKGRIWKAVFALARPETEYELLDVEINAAKSAIISVRPMRREARNA
jgi:hypothetical protein